MIDKKKTVEKKSKIQRVLFFCRKKFGVNRSVEDQISPKVPPHQTKYNNLLRS